MPSNHPYACCSPMTGGCPARQQKQRELSPFSVEEQRNNICRKKYPNDPECRFARSRHFMLKEKDCCAVGLSLTAHAHVLLHQMFFFTFFLDFELCIDICTYVHVDICMCVCLYVCMYVCMHVCAVCIFINCNLHYTINIQMI